MQGLTEQPNYAENGGGAPPRTPAPAETPEDAERWAAQLASTKPFSLEPWDVMLDRERPKVDVLLTPSCNDLCLRTPRTLLRPVRFGDSVAIKKIKTEPIVQKTQLYGTPKSLQEIKANFQTRYIASCIPAISRDEYAPEGEEAQGGAWRDEYIWAITVKPGKTAEVKILPPGEVRLQNRLTNLDGYVGESA
ncbi:hypothetical protein A1Q2_00619 [Trichosporon asahii var. asahii CBS 8904]|uniref:Uncharacterized protein n=1 Tax=Trichosporon asahii var. asahii (strain CBS 8904) TaxID=1220162 RepID=K1VLN4_TRIAC|nr:hypothetical protein A1Q2_00619 [Trichosporon asahii var. asahii CBS 8904]